ncbi:hypothetical protein E2C01_027812 [Portunus trituberculatus]|uniref:Uncharacterized protein n=1 Tax=Portunus trituberculatus TaxID=210409 RepID=A0A5B7EN68_PORTR|nr:hypothetical protein [Portunus trituberculatus]
MSSCTTIGASDLSMSGPSTSSPRHSTLTRSNTFNLDTISSFIRGYPAFRQSCGHPFGKGRKKVKVCILTENEEAINDMYVKEKRTKRTERQR